MLSRATMSWAKGMPEGFTRKVTGSVEALGDSVPLGEKDKAEGMVVHFEAGHGAFLGGKAFLDVGKICFKMTVAAKRENQVSSRGRNRLFLMY